MITYNDIYEAARKERYSGQLQFLPKNFVTEVSKYLKEKKQITMKAEAKSPEKSELKAKAKSFEESKLKEIDEFSDIILKTKKQLENAITSFKELIVRRRKKILNLVLIAAETGISKQDFENMLSFEKELFEDLVKCMNSSDKKLNGMLNSEKPGKVQINELVVFKENVESFVGLDAENMGPFEKGQIANIPKDITKILIEDGKVERIYE